MKYIKIIVLLGCTIQSVFGMEITQNLAKASPPPPGYVPHTSHRLEKFLKNETSRLMLSLDSTFKPGLQIQVQFFDKTGKQVADSISSFRAPGFIEIPQKATQCTLSTIVRHVPAKGSKIAEAIQKVVFNTGKMISLNFNNPSYMLSAAKGVYSATPVKVPVNQAIQTPSPNTSVQVVRELEHELLTKIYDLAMPQSCGPAEERRMPMPGTPEYAQYQQEELKDEAYAQKLHISTLKQIISYVETQIERRPECDAL